MLSLPLRFGRFVPITKGTHRLRLHSLLQSCCRFISTAPETLLVRPDGFQNTKGNLDFNLLFQSCRQLSDAKCLHSLLVISGRTHEVIISSKLINLYACLGEISFSRHTFDQIPNKSIDTCNSMISAYVRHGRFLEAVGLFYHFFSISGLQPDFYTFPPVVKACQNILDGTKIHCSILKLGVEGDVFIAASLINMYSRFGFAGSASKLFNDLPIRDEGLWNAMISGFCQNGCFNEALEIVDKMRLQVVKFDAVTAAVILPAYAQLGDFLCGKLMHSLVIKQGLELELLVSNSLINMYAKFGSLKEAQKVFDQMARKDIVSWNSIISAYEQNGDALTAHSFFVKMQQVKVQPDLLTVISLASICAALNDRRNSRPIHGFFIRRGWFMDYIIAGNAIVDMYAKIGKTNTARAVFEKLPVKDVISWNTLITGYSQNGLAIEAIEAYEMMMTKKEVMPNQGTWVSIIPAYSHLGALQKGMRIHGTLIKNSLHSNAFACTCLIDLYGKCGKLDDALALFNEVSKEDSVPWNAIIACLGVHGHGFKAIELFNEMMAEGVKPDHVTFVSLLSACSHSGLVSEGQRWFNLMQEEHGIRPNLKHYGCMVDLYGRAGNLEMAYSFIKDMAIKPDASMWGTLLGACRIHGNTELGKRASDQLFEIDSQNAGYYVLLSNIFATVGKWEGSDKVRSLARVRGLRKTPGWSSIEVNNNVDVFYTGNRTHPKSEEIYRELGDLSVKIKIAGYVPDFSYVLQDVEDDEKEQILMGHSERLAIAYGIISTAPGSQIRIFKNLRVCGDCHVVTKFISRVTEREIVVRDSNRFHHFRNGVCSCGDYW